MVPNAELRSFYSTSGNLQDGADNAALQDYKDTGDCAGSGRWVVTRE